jgi:hypothetical protein
MLVAAARTDPAQHPTDERYTVVPIPNDNSGQALTFTTPN